MCTRLDSGLTNITRVAYSERKNKPSLHNNKSAHTQPTLDYEHNQACTHACWTETSSFQSHLNSEQAVLDILVEQAQRQIGGDCGATTIAVNKSVPSKTGNFSPKESMRQWIYDKLQSMMMRTRQ